MVELHFAIDKAHPVDAYFSWRVPQRRKRAPYPEVQLVHKLV